MLLTKIIIPCALFDISSSIIRLILGSFLFGWSPLLNTIEGSHRGFLRDVFKQIELLVKEGKQEMHDLTPLLYTISQVIL